MFAFNLYHIDNEGLMVDEDGNNIDIHMYEECIETNFVAFSNDMKDSQWTYKFTPSLKHNPEFHKVDEYYV